MARKKLHRILSQKKIGGVCAGFGEYFGVDPVIIRILFVISIFISGAGLLAYLICYFIMPTKE